MVCRDTEKSNYAYKVVVITSVTDTTRSVTPNLEVIVVQNLSRLSSKKHLCLSQLSNLMFVWRLRNDTAESPDKYKKMLD